MLPAIIGAAVGAFVAACGWVATHILAVRRENAPVADLDSLSRMGVPTDRQLNVGPFSHPQKAYLAYHRREIFKKAGLDE